MCFTPQYRKQFVFKWKWYFCEFFFFFLGLWLVKLFKVRIIYLYRAVESARNNVILISLHPIMNSNPSSEELSGKKLKGSIWKIKSHLYQRQLLHLSVSVINLTCILVYSLWPSSRSRSGPRHFVILIKNSANRISRTLIILYIAMLKILYTYGLRELRRMGNFNFFLSITTTREEYHIWLAETVHKNM